MKATINNTFHGTSKNVVLKSGRNEIRGRRLQSWKRELCCTGCCCSGLGGIRRDESTPGVADADGNALETENGHNSLTGEEYLIVWA